MRPCLAGPVLLLCLSTGPGWAMGPVQTPGATPSPAPVTPSVPPASPVPTPVPVVPVPMTLEPMNWLGLTPESAYRERGAPAEIYPLAVDEKRSQVVHFYGDHTYLFWSSNRVWQVRLDKVWAGNFKGLTMGMPRENAETVLGTPAAKGDTWSAWPLPYQTFPRKIRVVFTDGVVSDIYLYRSDLQ